MRRNASGSKPEPMGLFEEVDKERRREFDLRVGEATRAWAEAVTRSKPDIDAWDGCEFVEDVNTSHTLDPSGITTFLLVRGLGAYVEKHVHVTAKELIEAPEKVERRVAPLRTLREVVTWATPAVDAFRAEVRSAVVAWGVQGKRLKEVEEVLADEFDLAYLRRDAFRSMETLRAFQFAQGVGATAVKMNMHVYEFWNVNSVLAAMRAQKLDGLSMVLVRNQDAMTSYFVFALKNGENLTILTDKDETPHPAYERMSRRPDRNLESREARHWFPYDLLDLKRAQQRTERTYAKARTGLVPYQVQAVPLKPVPELPAETLVWLVMVSDLIRKRYAGPKPLKLGELAYTGEMVREPNALLGQNDALVVRGAYKPLELPALAMKDVSLEATRGQWASPSTEWNTWMEERYEARVPEYVLNPVGTEVALLPAKLSKDLQTIAHVETGDEESRKSIALMSLETFDPQTFGSVEQLERDRQWVGRVNKMRVVQGLAEAEFTATKSEMESWYRERVRANRGRVLDGIARGEWMLPYWTTYNRDKTFAHGWHSTVLKNVVRVGYGKDPEAVFHHEWGWSRRMRRGIVSFGDPPVTYKPGWKCGLCGARAHVFGYVEVTCPEAVAAVAGVAVADLPWAWQHYYPNHPYYGNNILDRVEPGDWVLENPWAKLRPSVFVALCKTDYHERRKKLNLPRVEFNKKEENEERKT